MKRLQRILLTTFCLLPGASSLWAQTPTPTECLWTYPACTGPFAAGAQGGDILITIRGLGVILGFHPQTATYFLFKDLRYLGTPDLDGIIVDPMDPCQFLVANEDADTIMRFDGVGNQLPNYVSGLIHGPKLPCFDPMTTDLYIPDGMGSKLQKVTGYVPPGSTGVASTLAPLGPALNIPVATCFDHNGNFYVGNYLANNIVKYSAAELAAHPTNPTGVLFASLPASPAGIIYDGQSHFYVGTRNPGMVFRMDMNGSWTTLLQSPTIGDVDGVVMDASGALWATQLPNVGVGVYKNGMAKIDPNTGALLNYYPLPASVPGLTINPSRNVFVDDAAILGLPLPRKDCLTATPTFTPSPTPTPLGGPAGECLWSYASCTGPYTSGAVAGDILVTIRGGGIIAGFHPQTGQYYLFKDLRYLGGSDLDGIAVDPYNPCEFVIANEDTKTIMRMDGMGNILANYVNGLTNAPKIPGFDPTNGDLYIPDEYSSRLQKVKGYVQPGSTGTASTVFPKGVVIAGPIQTAFDPDGNLYVSNAYSVGGVYQILKFTAAALASGGATPTGTVLASFPTKPHGILFDGNGHFYVGSTASGHVYKMAMDGSYTTLTQKPQIGDVDGLVMDLNGGLWASQLPPEITGDPKVNGIVKIDPSSGVTLAYYPLPNNIGGVPLNPGPSCFVDDLTVLGLTLPRKNCTTPTSTPTPTSTYTNTPTKTYTPTKTFTPTNTPTKTATPTNTGTPTKTFTPTWTGTPTKTFTPTDTGTPTDTFTNTYTPTNTDTPTWTGTPTDTFTPTDTWTFTPTPTDTGTPTNTDTFTFTPTHTFTPTDTGTPTNTDTPTFTSTWTFTPTPTDTDTFTPTKTYTPTDTFTPTNTDTPTNTPIPLTGGHCTFTQGYWKNHNKYGANNNQAEPWPISEETQLCGITWYNILLIEPRSDAWYNLAHQWIAAMLNEANGSSVPQNVQDAMAQAQALLTSHCTEMPKEFVDLATQLTDLLDQYNNGLIGPGHCSDNLPAPIAYPNPAKGDQVYLEMPPYQGTKDVTVKVYTIAFRLVQERTFTNVAGSTDLPMVLIDKMGFQLANGVYYFKVSVPTTKESWTVKVLVLR